MWLWKAFSYTSWNSFCQPIQLMIKYWCIYWLVIQQDPSRTSSFVLSSVLWVPSCENKDYGQSKDYCQLLKRFVKWLLLSPTDTEKMLSDNTLLLCWKYWLSNQSQTGQKVRTRWVFQFAAKSKWDLRSRIWLSYVSTSEMVSECLKEKQKLLKICLNAGINGPGGTICHG